MSTGILTIVALFVLRVGVPVAALATLSAVLRRWDDRRAAL